MPTSPPSPAPARVLLTGAAGFIGAALARELVARGHALLGLDDFSTGWPERVRDLAGLDLREGDVGEPGRLTRLVQEHQPQVVFHLAARVGVRAVLRDPEGCRAANLRGVRELLAAAESLAPERRPRVFFASSSEVYREAARPLREGDATRPTHGAGRWAYAASKLRGEELLDAANLFPAGRAPVHLRFFNVVGPGQDSDSGMVLPTFIERAAGGEALPVHGDGAQVRTFAHVEEVARTLRELMELPELAGGPLNVGGCARTTIAELARLVAERAGGAARPERTDPRSRVAASFVDVRFREPELSRLAALGVSVPTASLERIVEDTLARHASLSRPRGAATRERGSCASPAS